MKTLKTDSSTIQDLVPASNPQVPCCYTTRGNNLRQHWIRGWQGPTAVPDAVERTFCGPSLLGMKLHMSRP
jgi:hypothetical protein